MEAGSDVIADVVVRTHVIPVLDIDMLMRRAGDGSPRHEAKDSASKSGAYGGAGRICGRRRRRKGRYRKGKCGGSGDRSELVHAVHRKIFRTILPDNASGTLLNGIRTKKARVPPVLP